MAGDELQRINGRQSVQEAQAGVLLAVPVQPVPSAAEAEGIQNIAGDAQQPVAFLDAGPHLPLVVGRLPRPRCPNPDRFDQCLEQRDQHCPQQHRVGCAVHQAHAGRVVRGQRQGMGWAFAHQLGQVHRPGFQ